MRVQLERFDRVNGDDDNNIQEDSASTFYIFKMFLAREKAMFKTLNMMDKIDNIFHGYFWAPVDEQSTIYA